MRLQESTWSKGTPYAFWSKCMVVFSHAVHKPLLWQEHLGREEGGSKRPAEPRLYKDRVGSCWIWIRPRAGLLVSWDCRTGVRSEGRLDWLCTVMISWLPCQTQYGVWTWSGAWGFWQPVRFRHGECFGLGHLSSTPCDAMRRHAPKEFSTLAPEHWYRKHAASPVYLLLCIAVGEVALPADAKHPWRATGGRKLLQQALGTTGSESE